MSYGDQRIVDLPKVLRALEYLKAHNPEYRDVVIDPQFKLKLDEALINRNEDLPEEYLLTQDKFVIKASRESEATNADTRGIIEKYRKLPHQYNPQRISDPYFDVMLLPQHHPDGNNGYTGWNRDHQSRNKRLVKLDIARYVRNRLLNADRRYAIDPHWMFFFYHYLLQKMLKRLVR